MADYFGAKPGFNDGLYVNPSENMTFGGLAGNDLTGEGISSMANLGSDIVGAGLDTGKFGENFGLGDLGSALGEGWDFLKGGLDTFGGLAGLYMDWDKLQSTKASARDAHNASAQQYNNYLTRAKNVKSSLAGKTPTTERANVKKSTV